MAKLGITINPTIIKNGGPITSDVYKSDATSLWTKGCLLKLASGLLTPVVDTSVANAAIDTAATGPSGARLFVALEDHLTAGTVFVSVQEVKADTVFEAQLLATVNEDATTGEISVGSSYAGYQIKQETYEGSGLFGIDVDNTTNPVFNVIDVSSNYNPHDPDTSADYATVIVKVLSAILA